MSEVDVYKSRLERTVKIQLSSEARPYSRKDVFDGLLGAGVPHKAIEALGVRKRNVEWEVTLCTAADRNCLLQLPAIAVKGHQVQVGGVRKSARRLRVFYLPYYVPITAITSQLVQKGVKVIKTFQEKDRETGLASNVWNVLVEVDSEDEVPDRSDMLNCRSKRGRGRRQRRRRLAVMCCEVAKASCDSWATCSHRAKSQRRRVTLGQLVHTERSRKGVVRLLGNLFTPCVVVKALSRCSSCIHR